MLIDWLYDPIAGHAGISHTFAPQQQIVVLLSMRGGVRHHCKPFKIGLDLHSQKARIIPSLPNCPTSIPYARI